jgi:hypothetical protein
VTTNMEDIERAYELGRAAERQKMADLASLMSNQKLADLAHTVSPKSSNGTRKPPAAKVSVGAWTTGGGGGVGPGAGRSKALKVAKAKTVARGVRKEAGPREKGVKKGILNLISSEHHTTASIIATSGFKERSVLGTLAGLKKEGKISQDENKIWHPAGRAESEQHSQAMIS